VAHNISRGNYYTGIGGYAGVGIADEIVHQTKPDFLAAAGHPAWGNPNWDTTFGFISRDAYDFLANDGGDYVLAERKAGVDGGAALKEAVQTALETHKRVFGLFGGAGGVFEFPEPQDAPGAPNVVRATTENPALAEIVTSGLEYLSRDPDGFFVMFEEGEIDGANHANWYTGMVGTVWSLDEAVKAAVAFVDQPGDDVDWSNTLLIVTADHDTGFMRLADDKPLGLGDLPETVPKDGPGLAKFAYPGGEVTYGTWSHSNQPVSLYAKGDAAALFRRFEGKWYPGTRLIDNTHIFEVMARAARVNR